MTRRGPRTSEGKTASSRNATTHGLTADAPVVRQVERIEDWEYHLDQVIASLEPQGYMEAQLAVRIAEILWRQRRIPQLRQTRSASPSTRCPPITKQSPATARR
jgi:hypothetical protein